MQSVYSTAPADWANKYFELARVLKKTFEHEGDDDTSCN